VVAGASGGRRWAAAASEGSSKASYLIFWKGSWQAIMPLDFPHHNIMVGCGCTKFLSSLIHQKVRVWNLYPKPQDITISFFVQKSKVATVEFSM
jgi:hypothetical protein